MFSYVLLLVLVTLPASTQESGPISVERFDALRAEGNEALYNLDYEEARRNFAEMMRLFPTHPAGPQSLAATLWLKQLNQSARLKASLYSDDVTQGEREKPDPKLVSEFRDLVRQAKVLSEKRLRQNPSDLEALYFLGAAEGLEASFAAGIEQRFMAALRSGSRSVDRHKEVLRRAPEYRDAELTIGLYNYVVGSLPLAPKLIVRTMGHSGSRKRGLEILERVAKEGHWTRDLARLLLIDLYKREKRWPEAAAVASELTAKYPRNYIFKLQIADALSADAESRRERDHSDRGSRRWTSSDEQRIFAIFDDLLSDRATTGEVSNIVRFRYGETLLLAGHHERSANEFLTVVRRSSESDLIVLARLRAAHASDLAGKRTEALNLYRAVLKAPDIYKTHEQARKGLREPYKLK